MLHLLRTPQWQPPGQAARLLPVTVPGCLLVYLATRADWLDREHLCDFFWPDEPAAQAQRKLRVTLHRLQGLLEDWGCADALQRERTRVRLALATDVQRLGSAPAAELLALQPAGWLRGYRLPGLSGFWDWSGRQARQAKSAWARAADRALVTADLDPAVHALLQAALLAVRAEGRGPGLPGADGAAAPPGRAAEVAWLRRSTPQVALLLAEAGAGKTTVLRAAAPSAAWLQGREGQAGVPFAPVLEWLRGALPTLRNAAADPVHPLHPYRLDLARLLPDWAPGESLPPLDAHTAKARLLEALARAADTTGALLLVDDLQWCDSATLEWLAWCAHRGRPLWWASARPRELPAATRQALAALEQAGRLQSMVLPPLPAAAVADICRSRWPLRDWTSPVLQALAQASAGNPFVLLELVAVGADRAAQFGSPITAPRRVRDLVQRRLQPLSGAARAALGAAAVLARPVSPALLREVAAPPDDTAFFAGCDEAVQADLLQADAAGLQCRHDLIRQTVTDALGVAGRAGLHRRAALALAARGAAEPLDIAAHWQAADEPRVALDWLHRGAQQHKERGHFEPARLLWQQVASQSPDPAQALRARLALAETDLLDDLPRGRLALQAVLDAAADLVDETARTELQAQALAGLVDNAVFAGDLPQAAAWAAALRALLPQLKPAQRSTPLEVLIELAMRQPDLPAGWDCLAQLRRIDPQRPSLLSWQGQIHWFGGDVRAARDAFEQLLVTRPDFCRGLTIENDLAVMLNALGEYERAETLARRSLDSWRGVPHTQALSLLVLGSVLTSTGRLADARAALDEALALARAQASPGFEAEAQVRLARLLLHQGQPTAAWAALEAARPLLQHSPEPLRVSQYGLYRVLAGGARGYVAEPDLLARLQDVAVRSAHPLVRCRCLRVQAEVAMAAGDEAAAQQALAQALHLAHQAGLAEPFGAAEAGLSRVPVQASAVNTVNTPV